MNRFKKRFRKWLLTRLIGNMPVIANVTVNAPVGWSGLFVPAANATTRPFAIISTASDDLLMLNSNILLHNPKRFPRLTHWILRRLDVIPGRGRYSRAGVHIKTRRGHRK